MSSALDLASLEWSALFDELKQRESITSDAKLAAELGVTRGYICSVRKGRKGLSLDLAEQVMGRLGRTFEISQFESLLVPRKVRSRARELSALRRSVIARAEGRCALCGNPAPFVGADKLPYLEIHYVVPVRDGGAYEANNLVALCPNCNRKMQYAATDADEKKLKSVARGYTRRSSGKSLARA
ncbi:MAG: HNH endonuclease signature motif containing protein [Burkholderiales bacterium]